MGVISDTLNFSNLVKKEVHSTLSINDCLFLIFSQLSKWRTLTTFFLTTTLMILWLFGSYLVFDPHQDEFKLKLLCFYFCVLVTLSTSQINFLFLFGWELVGWVSFRLIGHWLDRSNGYRQAFTAVAFNRIGDALLLVWIATRTFLKAQQSEHEISTNLMFITVLFFKSVVLGTYLWLPEAMEGPTPVSALLHSCTLVMAGIFIAIKVLNTRGSVGVINSCNSSNLDGSAASAPHLLLSTSTLLKTKCSSVTPSSLALVLGILGLLTSIMSTSAEVDAKRLVAYSTISMICLLWTAYGLASIHSLVAICICHACYKSMLFVSVGRLISAAAHPTNAFWLPFIAHTVFWTIAAIAAAPAGSSYASFKHSACSITTETNNNSLATAATTNNSLANGWNVNLSTMLSWQHETLISSFLIISSNVLAAAVGIWILNIRIWNNNNLTHQKSSSIFTFNLSLLLAIILILSYLFYLIYMNSFVNINNYDLSEISFLVTYTSIYYIIFIYNFSNRKGSIKISRLTSEIDFLTYYQAHMSFIHYIHFWYSKLQKLVYIQSVHPINKVIIGSSLSIWVWLNV